MAQAAAAVWFVPAGIDDPVRFLVLGGLAVMLMGAAKAGFAGAGSLLSVPLMIYACNQDTRLATGILLPLLIACDYVSVFLWRGQWDWRLVRILAPGAAVGIAVGWATIRLLERSWGAGPRGMAVSNATLNLVIGAVGVAFVAMRAVGAVRGAGRAFNPAPWMGLAAGAAAGAVSTLSHTAGPVVNMFLLPQEMPKARFVATTVLFFWIVNQAKLIPYHYLDRLRLPSLAGAAVLLPAIIAGALLGAALHRRVNQKVFTVLIHALLLVVGAHLIKVSAATLWHAR